MQVSHIVAITLMFAGSANAYANSTDQQIKKVTEQLSPGIVIKGEAIKFHTLAESMAKNKVPGVSIAVVMDGKLAWAQGFGVKASDQKEAVTPTTLFQAASISKPVTASAMLKLVEQGSFSLDAPINTYLKSWQLPENEFTKKASVTLRRLVTHSAGLNVHGFPGYASGMPIPTVPQILSGEKPANTEALQVVATPGEKWSYSGGGTILMQQAMSDVTGKAFPTLMQNLVLAPIGMRHSAYQQPLSKANQKNAAAGHDDQGKVIPGRWHTYPELAAAGLWTTPTDLSKWAIEIAESRMGKSNKVLSQKMVNEMLTTQIGPSGLGPMIEGEGEAIAFEHGGSNEGYRCFMIYFPALGRGAVIMTNGENGSAINREVSTALAREYQWPAFKIRTIEPLPLDANIFDQLLGEYPLPAASASDKPLSIFLKKENEKLIIDTPEFFPKTEIVLLASDELIVPENGFQLKVIKDSDGRISGVEFNGNKLIRKTP